MTQPIDPKEVPRLLRFYTISDTGCLPLLYEPAHVICCRLSTHRKSEKSKKNETQLGGVLHCTR
ncbi:hypothetical protein ES708_14387 [subsurface metagenome]